MPDEKVIQVQGHGEVEAMPDIAVINLGVVSRESEARAAMQAASAKMHAIVAAVRAQGVPDRDIQTTQLNLYLDPQANVYVVNHDVTVRCEDVGKAGVILDAAVEAGSNAGGGIRFALADHSEPESRALELAVTDARRKAETLAGALGVAIDGVGRVVGSGSGMVVHGPVFSARMPQASGPATPTPIEAGQLRIVADVQVTYNFH